MIHRLQQAEAKAVLKKRCRVLREKFALLKVNLDIDARNKTDPDLFFMALTNGVALCQLIQALNGVKKEANAALTEETPDSTLTPAQTAEQFQLIQTYCSQTCKLGFDKIVTSHNFLNNTVDGMNNVVVAIEALFEVAHIKDKINALDQAEKASREKTGGHRKATGAMSEEDFRRKVVDELLSTEQSYTKDLNLIFNTFIEPLKQRLAKNDDSDTAKELLSIFSNWEDINNFHNRFIMELEPLCADAEHVGEIGDLMQRSVCSLYKTKAWLHSRF